MGRRILWQEPGSDAFPILHRLLTNRSDRLISDAPCGGLVACCGPWIDSKFERHVLHRKAFTRPQSGSRPIPHSPNRLFLIALIVRDRDHDRANTDFTYGIGGADVDRVSSAIEIVSMALCNQ